MKKYIFVLIALFYMGLQAQTFNFECSEHGCTDVDFSINVVSGIYASFHKSDDITTTASITTVSDHPNPMGIEGSLDSFYIGFEDTDYITGMFRNTDVTFEKGDYIIVHQPAHEDVQDVYTLAQVGTVHSDAVEYSITTDNPYKFNRSVEIHKVHQ